MSGVVGSFAIAGSQVPCEPQITGMADCFKDITDHQYGLSDHRFRFEAFLNPLLDQSTFRCAESGSFAWLYGHFSNASQLLGRIGSGGAQSSNGSELLLRLYQSKGLLCVPMLQGSFCGVIWDAAEQRIVMFRDQMGTKPLFVSRDGDNLWFSTSAEALALLQPYSLNFFAFHTLLVTGALPSGESLTQKVESVRPGEMFLADRGRIRRSRYWQFEYEDHVQSIEPGQFQELIGGAVDRSLDRIGKVSPLVSEPTQSTGVLSALVSSQSRYGAELRCSGIRSTDNLPCITSDREVFESLVQQWNRPFGSLEEFRWAQLIDSIAPRTRVIVPLGESVLFGMHPAFAQFRRQQRFAGLEQFQSRDPLWPLRPLLSGFAQTKVFFSAEFLSHIERQPPVLEDDLQWEWKDWSSARQLQSGLIQVSLQPLAGQLGEAGLKGSFAPETPYIDSDVHNFLAQIDPKVHFRGVVGGQLLYTCFAETVREALGQELQLSQRERPWLSWLWPVCVEILREATPVSSPLDFVAVSALCDRLEAPRISLADQRAAVFLASFLLWR